jgi:hypothetical protein
MAMASTSMFEVVVQAPDNQDHVVNENLADSKLVQHYWDQDLLIGCAKRFLCACWCWVIGHGHW